jgi:UDP-N-acetylmuramyl pentapeptide synthase
LLPQRPAEEGAKALLLPLYGVRSALRDPLQPHGPYREPNDAYNASPDSVRAASAALDVPD